MKKTVILAGIFIFFVTLIIIVNQIQQLPIPDNKKYVVNPNIIGHYAVYDTQLSLSVLRFRLDYVAIVKNTQDVIVKSTLYLANGSTKTYYSLISITGLVDNTTVIYDNQVLYPSPYIYIPDQNFYLNFPIISPNLQQYDFVNLHERDLLMYNTIGVLILSVGGTFDKYTFRSQVSTWNNIIEYSYTWDRESGILVSYYNQAQTPQLVKLIYTDVWKYPWENLHTPTSIGIFADDVYNVLILVVGLYFMRWEVWALTFGLIGFLLLRQYLNSYLADRKAMFRDPDAVKYLERTEKQDEKVKWIV